MRLGFTSAILPNATFDELLKTAAAIGYDSIEVMCWPREKATRRYAGVTHIDVLQLDHAAIDKIKQSCARYAVSISGLGYYPNALSSDKAEANRAVEHICAVITAASKLDVAVVNTFIGRDWKRTIDDNWPTFLDTWRPIIAHAERHNIKIGIENCPMLFGPDEWPGGKNLASSPAIWSRMFEDIPSDHFGLNYDPSHMIFQHMDYLTPMREFGDKLFHVHAKDARIDVHRLDRIGILGYPNDYHTPKLPGMGDVDWGKFVATLNDTGYAGDVSVEVEDRAYEVTDLSRIDALRQSHTYLRNFIPKRPISDPMLR